MFKKITSFLKQCTPVIVGVAVLLLAGQAHAATGGGGNLPIDAPLQALVTALTGRTAFNISVIAAFACILAMIFAHHAISGWVQGLMFTVIGMALLSGIVQLAQGLGIQGAVIG